MSFLRRLHKSPAFRTATASYLAFASTALWGLVTIPVAVAFLDAERLGLWTVVNAFLSYLIWMDLGIGGATGRLIAKAVAEGDQTEINRWWTLTRATLLLLGFILILVGLAIRPLLLDVAAVTAHLREEASWMITGGIILTGISVPLRGVAGLLTAQNRFHWIPIVQSVVPWIHFVTFYTLLTKGFGTKSYIYAMGASQAATWVSYNVIIRSGKNRPLVDFRGMTRPRFRRLFGLSSNITVIGLVETVLQTMPAIIIARLGGYAMVPIYNFSWKGPSLAVSLVNKTFQSFYPQLQRLHVTGKHEDFKARHSHVADLVIGISLLVSSFILFANCVIVQIISSKEFYISPFANAWFAVAMITIPLTGVFRVLLPISGAYGKSVVVALSKIFFALALSWLLWNRFGMAGIAATFAVAPLITGVYGYVRGAANCGYKSSMLAPNAVMFGIAGIGIVWLSGFLIGLHGMDGTSMELFGKALVIPGITVFYLSSIPLLLGSLMLLNFFRKRYWSSRVQAKL